MGGSTSFPVVPLTTDRIIVVTGSNTGIGYEIAKHCAIMGATVIVACRSEERARNAIRKMQEEYESQAGTTDGGHTKLALEFMQVDLGSFKSVVNFCKEFKKSGRPLNVLFCNAGLGLGPYVKTGDGFEQVLQVNYLGHFLMVAKLLPVIKQSGPDCRVIFTSSSAHAAASTINAETMIFTGNESDYSPIDYYGRSKAYQIMQTFSMAQRLKGSNISVNCFHPGLVDTEFFRYNENCCWGCVLGCIRLCCSGNGIRTPLKGATCGIDLAVNPRHTGVSGNYWYDCQVKSPKAFTRDEQLQEVIWQETFKFVKEYLVEDEISAMEGK